MKIKNSAFLAKANLKGNTKTTSVLVTILILVISLTLISSFSTTVQWRIEEYKADPKAKIIEITPFFTLIDDSVINRIMEIEHVESVKAQYGTLYNIFDVLSVESDIGTGKAFQKMKEEKEGCSIILSPYIGEEKRAVIAGDPLENCPEFSCLIPDRFYPFGDTATFNEKVEYLEGTSFIGKTITIKPYGDEYDLAYNIENMEGGVDSQWAYLPALEYKLKIVGVYRDSPTTYGGPNEIFVSEETGILIEQMALEASSIDLNSNKYGVARWWNTPSIREHYVTVDDYDNIEYVCNKLYEMNIDNPNGPVLNIRPGALEIAAIFNVAGIILSLSSIILSILTIMNSSINALIAKRKEIGLLKAFGYKNKQIFSTLYLE